MVSGEVTNSKSSTIKNPYCVRERVIARSKPIVRGYHHHRPIAEAGLLVRRAPLFCVNLRLVCKLLRRAARQNMQAGAYSDVFVDTSG